MTEQTSSTLGAARQVPIRQLTLDPLNPRVPEELHGAGQAELASWLAEHSRAIDVAQSIAMHGFFMSEPVIAFREGTSYVVVEGNRRLTALLGLAVPEVRRLLRPIEVWEDLARRALVTVGDEIPVIVVPDRQSAIPMIGFRHITGILKWDSFAQARYVAGLVDDEGMTFKAVAAQIGQSTTKVSSLYRDQAIVRRAAEAGLDVSGALRDFSLISVAMSSVGLREHIGAQVGSKVVPGNPPVPPHKIVELAELFDWIFGESPVISDSRQLSRLGNVIANPVGLRAIRSGEDLDEAVRLVEASSEPSGTVEIVRKRLAVAVSNLAFAADQAGSLSGDAEIVELVRRAVDHVVVLSEATTTREGTAS